MAIKCTFLYKQNLFEGERMKKLNAFQLKSIAIIVMFMDHLYFAFSNVFSFVVSSIVKVCSTTVWMFFSRRIFLY